MSCFLVRWVVPCWRVSRFGCVHERTHVISQVYGDSVFVTPCYVGLRWGSAAYFIEGYAPLALTSAGKLSPELAKFSSLALNTVIAMFQASCRLPFYPH